MSQYPEYSQPEVDEEMYQRPDEVEVRRINSPEEAARYAYALSATQEELNTLNETAESERARWQSKLADVDEWHSKESAPLLGKMSYLRQMLTNYHVDQYYSAPNEKAQKKLNSIRLPYGVTLKSSQPQISYDIKDEDAYKQWMADNGFVEQPEVKLKWGDFKKTLTTTEDGRVVNADGEEITFLSPVKADRKFEVN